jgi:hypothetical protein
MTTRQRERARLRAIAYAIHSARQMPGVPRKVRRAWARQEAKERYARRPGDSK